MWHGLLILALLTADAGMPLPIEDATPWYAAGTPEENDAKLEAEALRHGASLEGARWCRHLAQVAEQNWRYPLAQKLYERALSVTERELGARSPEVVDLLGDLARLLRVSDQYPAAARVARRALGLRQALVGKDDPSLGPVLQVLAITEVMDGKLDVGEGLARQALELSQKGHDPLPTASALDTLGAVLQWRHSDVEAERRYREAVTLYRDQHADRTAAAAAALNNLGLELLRSAQSLPPQKKKEALKCFEDAAAAAEASLGVRHPFAIHLLEQLAGAYRQVGQSVRSLEVQERARRARGLPPGFCVNELGTGGCLRTCRINHACPAGSECIRRSDEERLAGEYLEGACFPRCERVGESGPDAGCAVGWTCNPARTTAAGDGRGVCSFDDRR